MSRVTVTWKGEQWLAKARKAIDDGLFAGAAVAQRHAVRSMSKPGPSTPGDYPGTDTGLGRASVVAVHPREQGSPGRASYGSNKVYMRKLEFGGRIEARQKLLTVPLNREAKLLRRRNPSLKGVPGLRLVYRKGHGGFKVMLLGFGKGKDFRPMFALKRDVMIPPRPWAMRAAREAKGEIFRRFAQTVRAGLSTVRGGA